MPPRVEVIGHRHGSLVVVADATARGTVRVVVARCDCGDEREYRLGNLRFGSSKSCGCVARAMSGARRRTHGRSKNDPLYRVWRGMIIRCTHPSADNYDRYGGAGVTVCERWRASFLDFVADMGERPTIRHSLERLDGSQGYEPGNVVWATPEQQARNRPGFVKLTPGLVLEIHERSDRGEGIASIARRMGLAESTVRNARQGKTWKEFAKTQRMPQRSPRNPSSTADQGRCAGPDR